MTTPAREHAALSASWGIPLTIKEFNLGKKKNTIEKVGMPSKTPIYIFSAWIYGINKISSTFYSLWDIFDT